VLARHEPHSISKGCTHCLERIERLLSVWYILWAKVIALMEITDTHLTDEHLRGSSDRARDQLYRDIVPFLRRGFGVRRVVRHDI